MVSLTKGQTVSLKKEDPTLNSVYVGLGWDPAQNGRSIDIDASIIAIDTQGRKDDVIAYYHLNGYSNAIKHMGDNLTGDGEGDDEVIYIVLDEIPEKVSELCVIINIYSAFSKNQTFGMINNAYVHVTNSKTNKEIVRYDLEHGDEYAKATGLFVADLYRDGTEWQFRALGEGVVVSNIDEMVNLRIKQSQGSMEKKGFFRRLFGG